MRLAKIILTALLLTTCAIYSRPPELTPKDTQKKINELLRAHVKYKTISKELVKRSLELFLEELDPIKTYLIEDEVISWTNPSETLLEDVQNKMSTGDYSHFEEIYNVMTSSISRRNDLEKLIESEQFEGKVNQEVFRDIKWTKSELELKERLLHLRALQQEAAENLDTETKAKLHQKLKKRRVNREADILCQSKHERKAQVQAYILKAFSASLDSHTTYLTPKEANQFMIQVQQKLFGIGAQLKDNLNGFAIVRLLEGSPAMLSNKLKVGDRIIAVNKEPVVGLDIIEAVDLIRGPKGTKVSLTILRETQDDTNKVDKFDIEITRDEIVLKDTRFESTTIPYGGGVIAHIKLHSFYQDQNSSSAKDIKESIEKIKSEHNLLGVVLDLRNNAGGILAQAVSVSGLFISKGIVVSVKDNSGRVQHLRNFDANLSWDGPLIVAINKASASASEIVAQSLQDFGRALIVGDSSSFGKGSYQSFTLESAHGPKVNPQGEYKVTRGIYYTVSGKSPQLHGVHSDIVVPGAFSELEIGESYSKFPLDGDEIKANFDDDLSDVHPLHRGKMKRLYKHNLQERLTTYQPLKEILSLNSAKRIELNQNYQNFLTEIKKSDPSVDEIESFGQNDLQIEESFNIMKDLIFLLSEKKASQASKPAA